MLAHEPGKLKVLRKGASASIRRGALSGTAS